VLVIPLVAGVICATLVASAVAPGIACARPALHEDRRVAADRVDSARNPGRGDESFLNAVGAVWPNAVGKSGAGYPAWTGERAATGFLVDHCHVLTNLHVVAGDSEELSPPLGRAAAFAVGQTSSERDRGALQGLRLLVAGQVIAVGDALVLDGRVHHPEDDWALIRLNDEINGIEPMPMEAADLADLPAHRPLWSAGYPSDHRGRRGDGFKLKDLWVSQGEVVETYDADGGLLLESTLQTTPGNSGGPVYVNPERGRPAVIGMVQSSWGNGIDRPNVQLLFTPILIARITAARLQTPCVAQSVLPGPVTP
jgi:V8-like Glu-specific endopeptidase